MSAPDYSPSAVPSPSPSSPSTPPPPPTLNIIVSFLLVGLAWGFTTPFIRRAAKAHHQQQNSAEEESQSAAASQQSHSQGHSQSQSQSQLGLWGKLKLKSRARSALSAAAALLRNPAYAVPLLLNVTGSVWFFLLIGQAELSLTVPVVNTLAFLFTVVGEWWVEGKVISRETLAGMALSVGGIALCVYSKNTA